MGSLTPVRVPDLIVSTDPHIVVTTFRLSPDPGPSRGPTTVTVAFFVTPPDSAPAGSMTIWALERFPSVVLYATYTTLDSFRITAVRINVLHTASST